MNQANVFCIRCSKKLYPNPEGRYSHADKIDRDKLLQIIDSNIEIAENSLLYHDVLFYNRIKATLNRMTGNN